MGARGLALGKLAVSALVLLSSPMGSLQGRGGCKLERDPHLLALIKVLALLVGCSCFSCFSQLELWMSLQRCSVPRFHSTVFAFVPSALIVVTNPCSSDKLSIT